jgi:hypothetical protein
MQSRTPSAPSERTNSSLLVLHTPVTREQDGGGEGNGPRELGDQFGAKTEAMRAQTGA